MTNHRHRVLIVVPHLGRDRTIGGAVRVVVDYLCAIQASPDFEPRLCVLGPEDPDYACYGLSERPVFLGMPLQHHDPRRGLRALLALRALIRSFEPDIIHSHLLMADIFSAAALLGMKGRHVVHLHDTRSWLVEESLRRRARRLLIRALLRASRATFIAVSEATRQYTAENLPVAPAAIAVVRNGLDSSWFTGSPAPARHGQGPVIIGAAGRLQPEKGHAYLLRAVEQLRQRGVACELHIAGGGTRMAELQELSRLLDIEAQVRFLGRVADMRSFYESLDVFTLPSVAAEGFSISILEAMALGKAVVASDVAGATEQIRDSVNGLIVPPGDVMALARALERLARDAAFRESLGRRAAERAPDFSLARATGLVLQYYRELLARPRSAWGPSPRRPKRFVVDHVPLLRPAVSAPGVLHVVHGLGRDGAISGSTRLAVKLTRSMQADAAYHSELCALTGKDLYWSAYGLARRPYFLELPRIGTSPIRLLASCRRLRRLVRACEPRILHSHTWPAALVSGFALRGLPVQHVVHIHDMRPWLASPAWQHRLRRSIHRLSFRLSRASFVACCDAGAEYARQHLLPPGTVVTTVRSGIDSSQIKRAPSAREATGPVMLGMAGALQALKGHRYLLEALARVRERGLDVRLMLAGYGGEEEEIRRLAEDLRLTDKVSILGTVKDMPQFMSALDIYVLPSLSEGLPLSILEAMAHGVPVIATTVGGIGEAVRTGEEGLLVPPADVPALASAIEQLARDPGLRQAMGQRGRQRVEQQFTVDRMVERTKEYYDSVLREKSLVRRGSDSK